jgi:polar amino acid transport system ATP-binding protein
MTALQVTNIQKSFGKTKVLRGVDFTLEEGKVLSVIGPSGGGKTTLLRCITGLEIPDTGKIEIDGEVIFDSESKQRLSRAEKRRRQLKMGLVFQQYHLFPQYTALQNITKNVHSLKA